MVLDLYEGAAFRHLTPNPSPQRGEGRPMVLDLYEGAAFRDLTPNPSPQRGEGRPMVLDLYEGRTAQLKLRRYVVAEGG